MITLKLKNIDEIKGKTGDKNLLIVCSLCPYWNFSREEVEELGVKLDSEVVKLPTICNYPEIKVDPEDYDRIYVLACGAGSQVVSEVLDTEIIPVADTTGIGVKIGDKILEYCSACGDCVLEKTAGICPIKRCPKSLLNGPCGGVRDGKCEVDDIDCAWILIDKRMKKFGKWDELIGTRIPRLK